MTKQEYKAKLESCAERAETILKNIRKDIDEADKMFDDKKPELRHGDFGMYKSGNGWIVLRRNESFIEIFGSSSGSGSNAESKGSGLTPADVLGNLFDLTKGWHEPLERFTADVHTYKIDMSFRQAPILVAGNWHTLAEAEQIWHKLGRLIATFKRKENKCSS